MSFPCFHLLHPHTHLRWSVGPEGTLNILVPQISAWFRNKFRIERKSSTNQSGFDMAALSSADNGIVGNPLFTGILATEDPIGKKGASTFLLWTCWQAL